MRDAEGRADSIDFRWDDDQRANTRPSAVPFSVEFLRGWQMPPLTLSIRACVASTEFKTQQNRRVYSGN